MITKLASFISECPAFSGEVVKTNFLGKEVGRASLEATNNKRPVTQYADGGALMRCSFVLALRESFGFGEMDSQRISDKCIAIENWIEEQNISRDTLERFVGAEVVSIGVSKCFELAKSDGASARYEAEIEVVCLTI